MRTGLIVGIGAGLTSGLILASAAKSSPAGLMMLFLLLPLPIAITGMGWGWVSALAASLAAGLALGGIIHVKTALSHLLAIGLPITGLCYLALLHREHQPEGYGRQPLVEWYPIGRILAASALAAGALATFVLYTIANDAAGLEAAVAKMVAVLSERINEMRAGMPKDGAKLPTGADFQKITSYVTKNLGAFTATTWMLLWCINLWIGAKVARLSGLLRRPPPDLSTIRAPRELSLAFAAAVILGFVPDYPGMVAMSFASAIMFVYLLVGLAIVHNI
ncbi:MAG TPA: DUF2232 domain-containing protein, partial [Hyphomicrobiaceae bacterium]|nr:DUF2232 domain-containing protein [Hyphomicrobiaceae bacterium]